MDRESEQHEGLTGHSYPQSTGEVRENPRLKEAVKDVYNAWTDPGINPRYHYEMQYAIRDRWPTLYYALEELSRNYK